VSYRVLSEPLRPVVQCVALLAGAALFPHVACSQDTNRPARLTTKWTFTIYDRTDSSPAIGADGAVYFGTFTGKLWTLNADGSLRWSLSAGREIRSSPALAPDGTVYFGCRDRKFYAVGPKGKKKWDFKTGAWVDSSPALAADGTIYFGSWDGNFYALAPDGTKKWQFKTGAEIVSSPAVAVAGRVYFGSHDRKFYALNPDGTKAWDYTTGGPIISSPAIDQDGTIYITSVDGFFYALTPEGALKWRLRTGGITESSPVIGEDGTLFVGVNKKLWAISREGRKLWEPKWGNPYENLVEASPLALADGSVCWVGQFGDLLNISSADPPANWKEYLYGHGHSSPAISSNGTIFINGEWTNFFALQASIPLARSPWPKFRANPQNTGRAGASPQDSSE